MCRVSNWSEVGNLPCQHSQQFAVNCQSQPTRLNDALCGCIGMGSWLRSGQVSGGGPCGAGANIQKRKSDWMGITIKFNLTAYLCLTVVLACQVLDTGIHPPCPDMIAGRALPDISHLWIEDCPHLTLFIGQPYHVSNPWLAILLLSGDIQSNPGPANTCQCTVCQRKVQNNDAAVSCDSCQNWSHTNCVGIMEDEYQRLIATGSFTFYCPSCT